MAQMISYATLREQLLSHEHLKPSEKDALLSLLSASGVYEECKDDWLDMGTASSGLRSAKQFPEPPERVYRMRGTLKINAGVEDVIEVTVNPINMKKWDWLAKELRVLQASIDRTNGINRLVAYGRFGITVFSPIFYDRDYLTRVTAARLPCGAYISNFTSLPEDVRVEGDPGSQSRVVRGHSGHSGWVLLPQEDGSTLATIILQMDPMGAVPLSVINYLSTFIPTSLLRVRKFAENSDSAKLAKMQTERFALYATLPHVGKGWAANGSADGQPAADAQGSTAGSAEAGSKPGVTAAGGAAPGADKPADAAVAEQVPAVDVAA